MSSLDVAVNVDLSVAPLANVKLLGLASTAKFAVTVNVNSAEYSSLLPQIALTVEVPVCNAFNLTT